VAPDVQFEEGKGIFKEFSEEIEAGFIPMRIIAILEAQETMQRGVGERDNLLLGNQAEGSRMPFNDSNKEEKHSQRK
jgi:hypothetical protein